MRENEGCPRSPTRWGDCGVSLCRGGGGGRGQEGGVVLSVPNRAVSNRILQRRDEVLPYPQSDMN